MFVSFFVLSIETCHGGTGLIFYTYLVVMILLSIVYTNKTEVEAHEQNK